MNKKYTLLGTTLVALGFAVVMVANAGAPQTRYRFYIDVPNKSAQTLRSMSGYLNRNGFDIAGVDLRAGKIEVLTSEEGLKYLKSKGMNGTALKVMIAGGKDKVAGNTDSLDQRYYNPAKIEAKLKDLNAKFPKLTSLIEIGKSLQGRSIWAIVVSTTPDVNDSKFHAKPTVMFDGMHHAREVMTPEVVVDIAESMLNLASKGAGRARTALEGMNIVAVPMVNVDGNAIVWSSDNMWRKNAHADGSAPYGVDINRNYPYKFAACRGSSGSKGAQDYHGTAGASEPETKALMSLAEKVRPAGSISYHSYSELVLYPYGCEGDVTGEHAMIDKLGKDMAAKLPSDRAGSFYTPGTPWDILYAVDGDSMSWIYSAFGAPSFVFEINQDFQPPYSLRDPTVAKHRAAWHHFLDQLAQHMLTVQVRDASGKPVQAAFNIVQIPHVKGERDFGTNMAGNFFKMLMPGNYSIETKAEDGRKTVTPVSMGDAPQTITITL